MRITASIRNGEGKNDMEVSTEGNTKLISIEAKADGRGSSVNGGELLFLSLATCFCNDIYREAAKRKMNVGSVNVAVDGDFDKEGEPGKNIKYRVDVNAPAHSPAPPCRARRRGPAPRRAAAARPPDRTGTFPRSAAGRR